jgi:hypothetical protein
MSTYRYMLRFFAGPSARDMSELMQELSILLTKMPLAQDPRAEAERFCEVLANAVVQGVEVDGVLLEEQVVEICDALRARDDGGSAAVQLAALRVAGTCLDFRRWHQVALADGRVATLLGWNVENVEPGKNE